MTRTVAQLVTSAWPPSASTQPQLLALVREAASLGRGARGPGPVMVWSPPQVTRRRSVYREAVTAVCSMFQLGLDPCVFWVCLDTMVRQLRATGDTNLASYSRHLATHHQLQLSSCQLYIQVNRYIRHYL